MTKSMLPPEHRQHRLSSAEESEVLQNPLDSLMRALVVLRDRWLVLLSCTALAVLIALGAMTTMKPYWRATATMVVNPSGLQVLDSVQALHDDEANRGNDYLRHAATQREIIKSRRIATASLEQLGLADDPVFLGVDDIQDPAARARALEEVDPLERLSSFIQVTDVGDSRILKISVEYPDPEVASDISNAVANAYLDYISSSRQESSEGAKSTVSDERELARLDLERKEAKLDAFKQTNRITSISLSDRQNLIAQNIITLSEKTKRAEAERYAVEATYEEAKRLREAGEWGTASFVGLDQRTTFDELMQRRELALQELREFEGRYGAKHPKIVETKARAELLNERLDAIARSMLAGIKAQRDAARQTEAKLRASLARENERALELGRLEPEYRALEREATTAAATYEVLARRDAELGVSNRVEKDSRPPVELLDSATVTSDPVRPRKPLILAAAILLGLGVGAIVALSIDLRDHRLRGVSDLKRILDPLQMQMLGHLPSIEANPEFAAGNVRAQKRFRDLYTHLRPQSHIAERCRALRTSITFNLGNRRCPVILVTSPSSGEGKSSLVVNLAASFCQANKSVLLMGADMRRPRLQQLFPHDHEHEATGLSTVLSGEHRPEQAIRAGLQDAPRRLSLLTCGPIPENPAELLEGKIFRETLNELRSRFDVILIDSPPVLPVVDPVILATLVDGVMVVARCRSTTRDQIRVALSELRQVDTNVLGVVLNDVSNADRGEGYAYAQSYYRDEDATAAEESPTLT